MTYKNKKKGNISKTIHVGVFFASVLSSAFLQEVIPLKKDPKLSLKFSTESRAKNLLILRSI